MNDEVINEMLVTRDLNKFQRKVDRLAKRGKFDVIADLIINIVTDNYFLCYEKADILVKAMVEKNTNYENERVLYFDLVNFSKNNREKIVDYVSKSGNYEMIIDFITMYDNYELLSNEDFEVLTRAILKSYKNLNELVRFYSLPFLGENNRNLIIENVCYNLLDAEDIVKFIKLLNEDDISFEGKNLLVKTISTCDVKDAYEVARCLDALTKEQLFSLTSCVCATDYIHGGNYILKYAMNVNNLHEEDKKELVDAILRTGKNNCYFNFLVNVKWLNDDAVEQLFKELSITALEKYELIQLSMKYPKKTKDKLKEDNNMFNIVKYILITLDLVMLVAYFKSIDALVRYYLMNKESIGDFDEDVKKLFKANNKSTNQSFADDSPVMEEPIVTEKPECPVQPLRVKVRKSNRSSRKSLK